jgi:hypothetical protein
MSENPGTAPARIIHSVMRGRNRRILPPYCMYALSPIRQSGMDYPEQYGILLNNISHFEENVHPFIAVLKKI